MAQSNPNIQFQIIDSTSADVTGVLDVNDISNFPIAFTYSIKDIQDPSSSKGSFSKTFQIPATGNNNKILKNLYSDSLYNSFQYIEDKSVRVFVDGAVVFQGKFQMKGTTYKGIPQHYECVVFGDNYKWVNDLSELNLCDIDFDASDKFPNAPSFIAQNRSEIESTWDFGIAGEDIGGVQTHVVFPLINTGRWNYNNQDVNMTPIVTPSDMFPAFYLYNILQCIFTQQGYTIESTFFEQNWFKRLTTLTPMGLVPNSEATIQTYSFEIENNVVGDWKEPLDYTDTSGTGSCSGLGSTFDGAVVDSTVVNDPSSLIVLNDTHTPKFINAQSPSGIATMSSTEPATIAGWYFGCYGFSNGSENARLPQVSINQCTGETIINGMNWDCIPCDLQGGATSTYSEPINADIFRTPFYGLYSFNGRVSVEMENAYAIADSVSPFDPMAGQDGTYQAGTGTGGDSMDCGFTMGVYPTIFQINRGVRYVANLYIMHFKESTGETHAILVDSKYKTRNPPSALWGQLWCEDYPLPSSPDLTFNMSFAGVQLEVLDDDDRIYLYTEVTCEMVEWVSTPYSQEESVRGLCQMKYRINSSTFGGNLTPEIIEGGSTTLASLLPCDTTQLDYVNGLTGLFNLMWQTNEITKTVTVEPRDTFFNSLPLAVDWTNKLDKSKDEKNKYIYNALKRNLCFSYQNDGDDVFVEQRNLLRNQKCELGSRSLNLGELYQNEEQKIGSDFYSPTYMFYDKTISTNQNAYKQPFIPLLNSEYSVIWDLNPTNASDNLPEKIENWNPRLLCWYGLQPLNQADGDTSNNAWKWGYNNNSSGAEEKSTYPFAGVYCDQDATIGGSVDNGGETFDYPSLYFENSEVNSVLTAPPYISTTGLYEMFWQFNVLTLLDRPKIKTAWFKLTPNDIAILDFRNLIHIKSAQSTTYWILNKIIDFKCLKNGLTQVELFEYHNARPLKSLFPTLEQGFGVNNTGQWTDYNVLLVNDGKIKITQSELETGLEIFSKTRTPLLTQGTQAKSLPNVKLLVVDSQATKKSYSDDGGRIPMGAIIKNGGNIGNNQNINTGGITIGNNLHSTKGSGIVIGNNNNPSSTHPIQIAQNGRTAMCVSATGLFMEGGGGVVYYEETTTGEMKEVMTGIPQSYDPITGVQQIFYTRCVKDSDDIF